MFGSATFIPLNLSHVRADDLMAPLPLLATEWTGWLVLVTVLLAIALILMVSWWFKTRRILADIQQGAHRYAQDDLRQSIDPQGPPQLAKLAQTINLMARQLDYRLQSAIQQQHEQEALLASMVEGVLAVDLQERVLTLNLSAAQLLGLDPRKTIGRSIIEVVRHAALQEFATGILATEQPAQADMVLRVAQGQVDAPPQEHHIQAHGTVLRDATGRRIGAVIVLHDVTRLHRLETVRRDFVANVSHEVKTPVSAIKAAVETLLDDPQIDPQSSRQFLQIIQRQADRLHALVEDLLTLARIEQDSDRQRVPLTLVRMEDLLQEAMESCRFQAQERGMQLELSCPVGLQARVNPPLLETAVVNLVSNAIKYSPSNTRVQIQVQVQGKELVIAVTDQGPGIEAEHLPRIFERFYRPDRSRNRSVGGTGLGLAIVRHSAQAQGGRATVQSVVGQGSTFRIHLPMD